MGIIIKNQQQNQMPIKIIKRQSEKKSYNVNGKSLLVQGIAPGVTNGTILRIFKNVGECWATIKSTDSFAVVDHKYQEDAQYAFEKLHGSLLGDQILLISFRKFEKKAKRCF